MFRSTHFLLRNTHYYLVHMIFEEESKGLQIYVCQLCLTHSIFKSCFTLSLIFPTFFCRPVCCRSWSYIRKAWRSRRSKQISRSVDHGIGSSVSPADGFRDTDFSKTFVRHLWEFFRELKAKRRLKDDLGSICRTSVSSKLSTNLVVQLSPRDMMKFCKIPAKFRDIEHFQEIQNMQFHLAHHEFECHSS